MNTIKYLFCLLITFFFTSNAIALNRDYNCEKLCKMHQKPFSNIGLIGTSITIIPESPGKCSHIECLKCHSTWIESFYVHEDDDETFDFWNCECKLQILESNGYRGNKEAWMSSWIECNRESIYDGYLSREYSKYFSLFDEFLEYSEQNELCSCFWPEISQKAATINNRAYRLFENLLKHTDLKELIQNTDMQSDFLTLEPGLELTLHGVTIAFVCHSFFYSDYDWICRDLEYYSTLHFNEKSIAEIKDKLDEIRETLALLFFDLYSECLCNHPHKRIEQELCIVCSSINLPFFDPNNQYLSSLLNNLVMVTNNLSFPSSSLIKNFSNKKLSNENKLIETKNKSDLNKKETYTYFPSCSIKVPSRPQNWDESDIYLSYGTLFNDLILYKQAIQPLTKAIHLNPANREAYIERAMAYFETNQLSLALLDYVTAKNLTTIPPFKSKKNDKLMKTSVFIPENKSEFSQGLVLGTTEGAKVSTIEFLPSIFSCCRGILNGLWAFVCSPIEVSQEMVNTAYAVGEFVNMHSTEECFQCVVPELRELSVSWHKLNDHSKGQKIGYIIGKYGVDIFAPTGIVKGVIKVRALKRANTMCTLNSCASSKAKQAVIVEESLKRVAIREATMSEMLKKGKILVINSNTSFHVMQEKHAWEKIIKLSGNVEEDFKKLLILLEENGIASHEYSKNTIKVAEGVIRREHEKVILNHNVKVIFNEYTNTGEIFLNNAWVVKK